MFIGGIRWVCIFLVDCMSLIFFIGLWFFVIKSLRWCWLVLFKVLFVFLVLRIIILLLLFDWFLFFEDDLIMILFFNVGVWFLFFVLVMFCKLEFLFVIIFVGVCKVLVLVIVLVLCLVFLVFFLVCVFLREVCFVEIVVGLSIVGCLGLIILDFSCFSFDLFLLYVGVRLSRGFL